MAMPERFDRLYDFDGVWTTGLADRYLPPRDLPDARFERVDGTLVMTPAEAGANSFGEAKLIRLLGPAAEAANLYVYGQLNLTFNPRSWIQPDVTVLHTLPKTDDEDRWVPVRYCTMAVEFVSPASRAAGFPRQAAPVRRGRGAVLHAGRDRPSVAARLRGTLLARRLERVRHRGEGAGRAPAPGGHAFPHRLRSSGVAAVVDTEPRAAHRR
ncbi:Uma2 family endonuclease [Micromonospora sp. L31]|uniref:Uma2 family endonuclease n=1 Tax=Micromonospora sp. L31 TaxID=3452213 RepID=UPI003F8A5101